MVTPGVGRPLAANQMVPPGMGFDSSAIRNENRKACDVECGGMTPLWIAAEASNPAPWRNRQRARL